MAVAATQWYRPGPSSGWALPSLVGALATTGLAAVSRPALAPLWADDWVYAAGGLVTGGALVLLGSVMLSSTRTRTAGVLLLLAGVIWPAGFWGVHPSGPGAFVSWVSSGLVWALLSPAIASYPGDQPADRIARLFKISAFVLMVPVNVAVAFTARPEWLGFPEHVWWPPALSDPLPFRIVFPLFAVANFACAGIGAVAVLRRLRRLSGVDRAAFRPGSVLVAVVALMMVTLYSGQAISPSTQTLALTLFLQGLGLTALPPLALALTVVRLRSGRAEIAGLVRRLSGAAEPGDVREALRTTLLDPTLDVLYRRPDREGYVDGSGDPVPAPRPEGRLAVPVTGAQGEELALVLADDRMRFHTELVEASVAAAGLALQNARLHADLRARIGEARGSRARILDAQLEERRRIERDLHDGVQQRLLALALRLESVRMRTQEPETASSLARIRVDFQSALAGMRDLARGIHPALLQQAGLAAALEPVVEGLPLPVFLALPAGRFDPVTEITAYYVVCEALANTVKHAGADSARVSGRVVPGGRLELSVSDDGAGGADPGRGSGLRGMADRVHAQGGVFDLVSSAGAGTRLRVELPC